jgi:RimJ/RimL family protein N-acetyltransferase
MSVMASRLRYEALTPSHAPLLYPVLRAEEVWRHIGPSEAATLEELAARFTGMAAGPPPERAEELWVNFAVRLADDGPYCGRIEATVHGSFAEIAYLFGPAFWGQGLATEAVRWLREHLRERFGVAELWAATRPENSSSARLLRRLGFVESPPVRRLLSADAGDLLFRWTPEGQ